MEACYGSGVLANEPKDHGADRRLPLVLLPGTLCDARVFQPLQQRLGDMETQVLLTLEARSMRDAAEGVLARAPEQFVLIGFSLGGMIAMETALAAPERVRGLALISTTALAVPPGLHGARRAAVENARTMGVGRFLQEALWPQYAGLVERPEMLPLLQEMAESLGHGAFANQTELALGREDFCPRLSKIKCPVLLLAGEEDKLCPPAAQRALAAALPRCTCVMLPRAGHFALLESPDEVAQSVAAWFHTIQCPTEQPAPRIPREEAQGD